MMRKQADSKTTFKFLDSQLLVKRVKPDPVMLLAHIATLNTGAFVRYSMTRFEIKTFTFSAGSKYLSIDNGVLGSVPKVSSSPWLTMPILYAQWTRTPTNFGITITAIFRYL